MHSRIKASRLEGVRRVMPWLAALACCLTLEARATSYLRHVAPPPLREIEPAPLLAELPPATPVAEEVSAPKEEEIPPVVVPQAPEATTQAMQPAPASGRDTPVVVTPQAPNPPPVLQDPLRERVTLEDLLPYFTPPRGSGASSSQPLSSATYRRE